MAINAGDLGGLGNWSFPEMGSTVSPSRRIPLSNEEAEKVIEAKKKFDSLNFNTDSLFELFNDWQSSKTKSVKRFTVSFSFILTLALVAGVNIINIELFQVQVSEGREFLFSIALLIIHFGAFFYYTYLKSIDLDVQKAKVSTIEDDLEECEQLADEIDKIVAGNKIPSVRYLFNDFSSPIADLHSTEIQAYEAIKFYKDKLKASNSWRKWGEKTEYIVTYILYSAALVSIICSFYG